MTAQDLVALDIRQMKIEQDEIEGALDVVGGADVREVDRQAELPRRGLERAGLGDEVMDERRRILLEHVNGPRLRAKHRRQRRPIHIFHGDGRAGIVLLIDGHRPHHSLALGIDHIDEGSVRPALDRGGRHHDDLLERIDQEADVDELSRPQRIVRVAEYGLEPQGAGGRCAAPEAGRHS